MQVDHTPFPVHAIELQSPKILIWPSQAKSTKRKNIIIGEERSEPLKQSKKIPLKKSPKVSLKNSTLAGQEQEKSTRSAKISLTGLENKRRAPGLQ